jgi:ferredoxin
MHEVRLVTRRPGRRRVLSIQVEAGTTLLAAVEAVGLPIARGCGRAGLCGRCGVRVFEGAEALAPESPGEADAKRRNRVAAAERLACRCLVAGPLAVSASYW